MFNFKIFNVLKYKIVRIIEGNPLFNLLIYNNIKYFKFLLPHEKDYLGMKKICKNELLYEPRVRINSEYTIIIDINKTDEELLMSMNKKHRYYVRKALKENIEWDYSINDKNISDFLYAHNIMVKNKGLKSPLLSFDHLKILFNYMNNSIILVSGRYQEQLVSACVILIYGEKAFYYKAVSCE